MSHFRQVRTRMKRLDALHLVLEARGYTPISMRGRESVSVEDANELRISPSDIKKGNMWEIRFVKGEDGSIDTRTDTDIFKTGRGVAPELVNRAGNGIDYQFENSLVIEYAVEAALLTMAEQGFTCDRESIQIEGRKILITGTKDNTATFSPSATVATSNLVVL